MMKILKAIAYGFGCLGAMLVLGLAVALTLGFSLAVTCAVVYLVCLCFGFTYSWLVAIAIWLVISALYMVLSKE